MPTQPEVLAIEEAHRAAQARLGIAGAYLALRDWSSVSATATVTAADAWLQRNLQMIRAIQRKSVRLAKAYYQVVRALETGYTLGLPEEDADFPELTMGHLRQNYLNVLMEVADLNKPNAEGEAPLDLDEQWLEDHLAAISGEVTDAGRDIDFDSTDLDSYIQDWLDEVDESTDDTEIKVDDYEWPDEEDSSKLLRELFADEIQAYKDEQAEKARKLQESEELTAKEAARKVQKLHDATGSVTAGKADKAGIDAGRNMLEEARKHDKRVLMVARATGPNPCAFCAMLASRGFAYTSKSRAGMKMADRTHYHENCHCYPVYRFADIPDPTAAARSEHFAQLWDEEVRKKNYDRRGTKNDALNAFRRALNAERRAEMDRIRRSARKSTA